MSLLSFRSTSFAVKKDQGKQEPMSGSFVLTEKYERGAITFARHINSKVALGAVVRGQEALILQGMDDYEETKGAFNQVGLTLKLSDDKFREVTAKPGTTKAHDTKRKITTRRKGALDEKNP